MHIAYPRCPLLLQPVFCCPAWEAWVELIRQNVPGDGSTGTTATVQVSEELFRAHPEIADQISRLADAFNAVKSNSDVHKQKLEEMLSIVGAVANGKFRIALPGPFPAEFVVSEPGQATRQPHLSLGETHPPSPSSSSSSPISGQLLSGGASLRAL